MGRTLLKSGGNRGAQTKMLSSPDRLLRPHGWGKWTLRGRRELANIDIMQPTHDKLIARAAKKELGSLGFARKGRSRTWIADHGWWATIVEFQPSSWSKGSYLNVAPHWLWSCNDFLSFDFGGRLQEHVPFESDEQFSEATANLAALAAADYASSTCTIRAAMPRVIPTSMYSRVALFRTRLQ